ncbi:Retrovirus-related Pol polyprotein from transposon 17.6 [Vitis vinifera]|uniref:Retrovirus-related Pol polyprotein from transposon 17.6 n=1 Tax=Vitis vinifera TaxID=29760 RepID=A0A438FE99_VITVI|nr:Retrovirus-related Pol polyprotein from transposon 17.6 [Vitis vinifera]
MSQITYSIYKQLGLGELKPTSITLSLADRSVKIPRGEEKGLEEVCMIDNLVEEHCDQKILEDLNENFEDLNEGVLKPLDSLATLPPLKTMEEILPLFNEKETQEAIKEEPPKLILKPLPTKLKISPLVCTHHIYMEEEAKPVRQPSEDSPWVSPTQVVPKKLGITVVQNDKREEVSTRLTSGWRVCIDYRKLNVVTRKDHFPLPFIDQLLERVSGHPFYCFLDGYSGAFDECLVNLEVVLNRCIEKDLVLNWEKCHFMVPQGIVLGHIISSQVIEELFLGKRRWKVLCDLLCKKTLNEVQRNYTTIEKELLAVVFALDKFHAYLVGSFIVVFTDHSTLKYLLTKQDAKLRLIKWILLLQEFNLQIKDKKGVENVVADHLSRLAIAHNSHNLPINDDFPEESLMLIKASPWYAHIANYLVTGEVLSE